MGKNELNRDEIIKEIYWIFRDAIHNKHIEVRCEDKKITPNRTLPETSCYVCDVLHEVESKIADIFGQDIYDKTKKVEEKADIHKKQKQ